MFIGRKKWRQERKWDRTEIPGRGPGSKINELQKVIKSGWLAVYCVGEPPVYG